MMKIYEFQVEGEKVWIAATTMISAFQTYCNRMGVSIEEMDYEDDVIEIPKEQWSELTVKNTDYDPEDKDDWESMTFEEAIKNMKNPDLVALTICE